MTQEDKELLLKDLCSRLPYGVKVTWGGLYSFTLTPSIYVELWEEEGDQSIPKVYLRPMSSMTEEERQEWYRQSHVDYDPEYKTDPTLSLDNCHLSIDWLNAHHFDYRGLIEKGLALEAPKDVMYEN